MTLKTVKKDIVTIGEKLFQVKIIVWNINKR